MTQLPLPPTGSPQNARDAQILYERIRTIALWYLQRFFRYTQYINQSMLICLQKHLIG